MELCRSRAALLYSATEAPTRKAPSLLSLRCARRALSEALEATCLQQRKRALYRWLATLQRGHPVKNRAPDLSRATSLCHTLRLHMRSRQGVS